MHLIRSKIERPRPTPHLVRPRIVEALEASTWSALATMVVGRAGTGKSVAAHDLAEDCPGRVAWYTVDASDTDFERFAGYLAETLGLPVPSTAGRLAPDQAAERLLGELFERSDVPSLLVVEDLHLLYDTPWFGPFIARFLPMLPTSVHVLVTTRALPPVPLWRMRSKQTLSVVDEGALAFTEAEAIQLFARYRLSEAAARAAVRSTGGRAVRLDAVARCLAAGHAQPTDTSSRPNTRFLRTG